MADSSTTKREPPQFPMEALVCITNQSTINYFFSERTTSTNPTTTAAPTKIVTARPGNKITPAAPARIAKPRNVDGSFNLPISVFIDS